ncbi:MAG TPA: xylulokinase, partial [Clostridiales bacterium]|nr:xylulokinase [Clostridiales bacterium]
MSCFMGIDAGTSGVKVIIITEDGKIAGMGYHECNLITPRPGWTEQSPEDWWAACDDAVKQAVQNSGRGNEVEAIGFSGQMQGVTLIGADDKPLRNCIIWLDQRADAEVAEIERTINPKEGLSITANYCLNSFWAPKLLWVKKHEPEYFEKTKTVLFAKDYLRLKMTGEAATEVSDASLTYLLDVPKRKWAYEIFDKLGIPRALAPEKLLESQDVAGYL